jgi:hypothetical protein
MSHKTFPTRRTIEAVQGLLDNHCERVHPKRHRTGAQKATRAKKNMPVASSNRWPMRRPNAPTTLKSAHISRANPRPAPMPDNVFRALCAACGWSPQAVARMCGRRRNAGTDWATGRLRTPPDVLSWLEAIRVALAALPPPTGRE